MSLVPSICAVLLGAVLASSGSDATAGSSLQATPRSEKRGGAAFLDTELNRLLAESQGAAPAARSLASGGDIPRLAGRVKVSFVFRDVQSAEDALTALPAMGAEVTARYRRLLDAWVPVVSLADLGTLPGLMIAHRPFSPYPVRSSAALQAAAGTVVTEGLAAAGADAWLGAGVDGGGVAVGIIDSFGGYDAAQAAGEVPAAVAVGTLDFGTPQGTACAEVVHDMAPGAELLLASATTTTEAASAIGALASMGVEVISSSQGYLMPDAPPYAGPGREPGDGSSALCQAISEARTGAGTLFVQAAGNLAQSHWDGTFVDTDRNVYHEFAPGDEVNEVALGTGTVATFLRWDAWPASDQDYDLELVVANGSGGWNVVAASQNVQSGTQPPWEFILHELDPGLQYGFRIKKYGATHNAFMVLTDVYQATFEHAVPSRSLIDVAACPAAIVVAALDVHAPDFAVKGSSSRGPTYGPEGTLNGGLDLPRIGAYSSVDTLSYGQDAFDGTNAAAPHVAGAVALVWQRQSLFTPDQVQAFIEARAVDVASTAPGYDHDAGVGRLVLGDVGPCAFQLSAPGADLPLEGGEGSFDVTTQTGCPWEAVSSEPWLSVAAGSPGIGSGTVSFSVETNGAGARVATLTVGGAVFTVSQASASCAYELASASTPMAAAGGDGSVDVTTNIPSCEWTAASNAAWITVTGGSSGAGDGTVTFSVAANDGEARTGTITIANQVFSVEQAAVPCTFELSAVSAALPAGGGDGGVEVATNLASCEWTATANDAWITVTGGAGGTGDGAVAFSVAANDGEARSGTITIADLTFTVEQAAMPCTFGLSATEAAISAAGGDGGVDVTTNLASCGWTAVSNDAWITVTGGAAGTGSGAVAFTVATNPGEARSGTVTIAGHVFSVEQAPAPCAFELGAPGASVAAVGGPGSVDVASNRGSCAWTAVSNANWITVTGGAAGSGSGTVSFAVAANLGDARLGTITIAGETFTVDQAAVPCAFELASQSAAFSSSAGEGTVGVSANIPTCGWTAISNAAWVTVTGGQAGTGSGSVSFAVAANAGAARTGTLTIAGATFTVLQGAAGCHYSLYSWSSSYIAEGGTGQTRVWTSQPSCTWNSISNAPSWLTITSGQSGTGSEIVTYEVAVNPGLARQASLTVAGRIYTVYQDGAPCTFALSAGSADLVAAGGTGTVDLIASNPACAWTAVSSAPAWLAVTSGAAGTGSGTVSFAVGANAGDIRTATLTIGGQTFTVHQASPPCTYEIDPVGEAFAAIGGSGVVTVSPAFASCAWTAESGAPWLTITAGAAGVGAGIVEFGVADNPGEPRSGTLTVAGHVFTVTQEKHGVPVRRIVKRQP